MKYNISFQEAFDIVMEHSLLLNAENVAIPFLLNRVVANDFVSEVNYPDFAFSGRDGIAIKYSDVLNASNDNVVCLHKVKAVYAGSNTNFTLKNGECCEIMTGAPIPLGADSVIPLEEYKSIEQDKVLIKSFVEKGKHVRPVGIEVKCP